MSFRVSRAAAKREIPMMLLEDSFPALEPPSTRHAEPARTHSG